MKVRVVAVSEYTSTDQQGVTVKGVTVSGATAAGEPLGNRINSISYMIPEGTPYPTVGDEVTVMLS
jgi:hypothetical protein